MKKLDLFKDFEGKNILKKEISEEDIKLATSLTEIEQAERNKFGHQLGDDCDAKNWLDLRDFLKEHLNDWS